MPGGCSARFGQARYSFEPSAAFPRFLAYGAAIPIVSGHSGLSTFGGSEGVGWATTRAVVNTSLTVIMLDMVISAIGYLVFKG